MNQFANSELILNENNKVYHLNLSEEEISQKIITVGDPNRVSQVASFFEKNLFTERNREFHTITGLYKNEKITIISTGIGVDNIDIVLNELDALVNIDLTNRKLKDKKTSLTIVRLGTSGSIHPDVQCDDFLLSKSAIGLDGFIYNYKGSEKFYTKDVRSFEQKTNWNPALAKPYLSEANHLLFDHFKQGNFKHGITLTANGFYGPQARSLRLQHNWKTELQEMYKIKIQKTPITNLEMETAGIYALAELLGHKALSCNAILAERISGNFSSDSKKTMDKLIKNVLDLLCTF